MNVYECVYECLRTFFFIVTVAHGRMVVARYSQNRNENANSVKMKRKAEKKAKAIYTLAGMTNIETLAKKQQNGGAEHPFGLCVPRAPSAAHHSQTKMTITLCLQRLFLALYV